MDNLINWFNGLGSYKYYLLFIVLVVVIYVPFLLRYQKRTKKQVENWVESHPDAAKVYFQNKSNVISSNDMTVYSNSQDGAANFNENIKRGIYLTPGTHVLTATFTTTRPGVMHKTVTKQYGPTNVEVEVKANGTYNFYFDKKKEEYVIEEVTK